jgi:F-type H+-transporting ATPase subunit b
MLFATQPVVIEPVVPVIEPVVEPVHTGLQLFLPTWPDVIWSAVVLAIIAFAFYRFIMPKFMGILDKRSEMIDGGIKQAEQVRQAAQQTLAERHKMLEEAQVEAAKTRDAARAEGAVIIKEARENAAKEAARIEATAQRNLESQRALAESQLRSDVGRLATQLAGKIIGAALVNEATKTATIDRFIDELEQADLGAAGQHGGRSGSGSRRQQGTPTSPNANGAAVVAPVGAVAVAERTDVRDFVHGELPEPTVIEIETTEPVVETKERRHFFRK